MSHPWTTLTTTALLGLTLASSVEARKPKASPPPPSVLTMRESFCQTLGALGFTYAQARDDGRSYLQVLTLMRRTTAALKEPTPAWMITVVETMLRGIYVTPSLAPVAVRRDVELACLKGLEPAVPTPTPTTPVLRY